MAQESKLDNKAYKVKEKIRKQSSLSFKTKAHLETLKKYYPVDMAKREITIPFHFATTSEIVEEHVGSKKHPIISRALLQKISSIAHSIPREFKINIDLKIENYQGYDPKDLTKAIIDAFEVFQYDVGKEKTTSGLKIAALIIIGVILLAWLYYICSKHWFGQSGDPTHDTIHELVYTVGAVVVWEAIYIVFLPTTTYQDISYGLLKRIGIVRLKNKNNVCLDEINGRKVYNKLKLESNSEVRARKILLVSGTALICVAGCKLCDIVEIFIKYNDVAADMIYAGSVLAIVALVVFAGIGAINYYRDKGLFKNWVFGFGIATVILCLTEIIFVAIQFDYFAYALGVKALVLGSLILCLSISYLVCIVLLRQKRLDKKIKKGAKIPLI